MKNIISTMLIGGVLLLSACDRDDANPAQANQVFTVDEVIARAMNAASDEPNAISFDDPLDSTVAQDTTVELEFGPFTVTPTLSRVLTNHHVVLTSAEGYEEGVYLCDVYRATARVTLPEDAIIRQVSASKASYASYQGASKVAGPITIGSLGSGEYTLSSWSITPKYDQLGHTLSNRPLPSDLTEITFTYSYLRII